MNFRFSGVACGAKTNLLGDLLHRRAAAILIACAAILLAFPATRGDSAEKRSVPNIVVNLADDKY